MIGNHAAFVEAFSRVDGLGISEAMRDPYLDGTSAAYHLRAATTIPKREADAVTLAR
jgi:hypothetical protein